MKIFNIFSNFGLYFSETNSKSDINLMKSSNAMPSSEFPFMRT